jgi:hypothetical protein
MLNVWVSFSMRAQVSHPYKIIVLMWKITNCLHLSFLA